MAERIEAITPTVRSNRAYPWEEWTDGSAWLIRRGEDFTCSPPTMRQNIITQAMRKNLVVTTHISTTEPDVVKFQFRKRDQA